MFESANLSSVSKLEKLREEQDRARREIHERSLEIKREKDKLRKREQRLMIVELGKVGITTVTQLQEFLKR